MAAIYICIIILIVVYLLFLSFLQLLNVIIIVPSSMYSNIIISKIRRPRGSWHKNSCKYTQPPNNMNVYYY